MNFLQKKYVKMMCDKLSLSYEDLTENEILLINSGYVLFEERIEDIRILNEENRRISIELANIKSYLADIENDKKNNTEWEK
jgi:hypothetical protein